MLDLAILAILLIGFLIGLRRGFILQLIHLTGFVVAFIAAYVYYNDLAPKLKLWIPFPSLGDSGAVKSFFDGTGLDMAYYNAIAFAIIFFAAKIVWQMIGSMLDFIAHLPILKSLNRWGGGILGFLEVYLIIFIVLYIAALLPVESVQEPMNDSFLAEGMVKNTPFLSGKVKELWFQYTAS
ncbi:CvpA family protein [Peribacillus glennii]|uniref:CvpA family protein n=1 Tax=Peribacillus glennii TaxID=2303991 RepID=A0A372LI29_9BACI|nr:CvpA family protein [Peribacillus glennii]RFU65941.1 CvpA family protein [Peribacillus glennii]